VTEAKLTHYRIDTNHSNAYGEWQRMGSPIAPNDRQYRQLQEASNLAKLSDAPATLNITISAAPVIAINRTRPGRFRRRAPLGRHQAPQLPPASSAAAAGYVF